MNLVTIIFDDLKEKKQFTKLIDLEEALHSVRIVYSLKVLIRSYFRKFYNQKMLI